MTTKYGVVVLNSLFTSDPLVKSPLSPAKTIEEKTKIFTTSSWHQICFQGVNNSANFKMYITIYETASESLTWS